MNTVTKKKAFDLVIKYAPTIHKVLRINTNIEIIVCGANKKTLKEFKLDSSDIEAKGLFIKKKKTVRKIFIYFNNHSSMKDLFGTLVHEYMHVGFDSTISKGRCNHKQEEKLIRLFEKLFLKFSKEVWK